MFIHVVSEGETAFSVSQNYGVFLDNMLADNGLQNNPALVPGQALVIRLPLRSYTVREGDTLSSISQRFSVDIRTLLKNNFILKGQTDLVPGTNLIIEYADDNEKTYEFETNSYAYPNIEQSLLMSQLPYLTYFTPFTYGIKPDGSLVDLDDAALISLSKLYGVAPLMHLSSLTEYGNFSNERANLVLTNAAVQERLISEIMNNIDVKGYSGLDVDFEFIYPEDRFDYVRFLQNLHSVLGAAGLPLFSALAPKVSDAQAGILYEGHDYGAIGASVDRVLLMTYEWGYTYGPPMAVAPLNKVKQVVDYALTRVSASKLYLGIPTYGYDWTLPYNKEEVMASQNGAPSISPVEAISLAQRYNAIIQYDRTAESPWFRYTDESGTLHEVWFEDARSIKAKLDLAYRSGLVGIGYWNSMRDFPQNWVVLNALYYIKQL